MGIGNLADTLVVRFVHISPMYPMFGAVVSWLFVEYSDQNIF